MKLLKCDYCVSPETKILTSSLHWYRADEIVENDELLAFGEEIAAGHKGSKYEPSKVLRTARLVRPCYKITTDRGEIIVSAEHRFITRKKFKSGGGPTRIWIEAQNVQVGTVLAFTISPWQTDDSYSAGYLAGAFDGEGWVSSRHMGIGQGINSPLMGIVQGYLDERNIPLTGKSRSKSLTNPVEKKNIANMWDALKLIGSVRPKRLLLKSRTLWEGARTWGKLSRNAIVTNIEFLGDRKVIALHTSTQTYISNGFMSHNSQLEFRVCLWFAGVDPKEADGAFEFLVSKSEGSFEEPAKRLNWTARDVAKSLVHGGDYMEGLSVRSEAELNTPKALGDRAAGALIVYDGKGDYPLWQYKGKIVCFTGVNLSERLFGDKTRVNRAKALNLQKIYLDAYPIRQFQMDLTKKVEATGEMRLPSGHRLPLQGRQEEDDLKQAAACLGQGGGHIYAAEGMLRFKRRGDVIILHVYDENVFEVPEGQTDEWYLDFLRPMVEPSVLMPGFTCPAKAKIGDNWQIMRELGTISWNPS